MWPIKTNRALRHTTRGFTLVELLVVLALVSLISLALAGSLRFGGRVWERVQPGSERSGVGFGSVHRHQRQ